MKLNTAAALLASSLLPKHHHPPPVLLSMPHHPIRRPFPLQHPTNITPPKPLIAANHLLISYVDRGNLRLAHQLFAEMPQKNIVSWTILVSGYARYGNLDQSFRLFSQMLSHCCTPNDFAYASLLSACDYPRGIQIHGLVLKSGFAAWIYVSNALISMYWKSSNYSCNAAVEAWSVFDEAYFHNLVSYNSMITGLGMHGQVDKAVTLFKTMLCNGIQFDRTTLLTLVSSLCRINGGGSNTIVGPQCCLQLHSVTIKAGLVGDVGVATALIQVYSSFGQDIGACHKLFLDTSSSHHDVLLWTATMTSFATREPEHALLMFNQMRREDLCPDCYSFTVILKACASLVMGRSASTVHSQVVITGFVHVLEIGNALIHAYARCGLIDDAEQVFYEMSSRDVVSWNSMLKAYALHGRAEDALQFFQQMNVEPDETTFVALISSCSHAGKVKEGYKIFDSMYNKYGITAQLDHYACMVDMLGRSGLLAEAKEIINRMPMQPDSVIWSALLGACRKHGESKLANLASSKLMELDPENSLGYVMMSNIYCSGSSFDEGGSVRRNMKRMGVRKEPGLSWTEVGHQVHEFASGGWRHPQLKAIRSHMEKLLKQLKKLGYVPDTSSVLFDVEEEHKEEQLYHHSEKLALVFSLMNNSRNHNGSVIKIMKNIRICEDCHNFMRVASKLVEKAIIVRDANRFHHFSDGTCSCNDYW